MVLNEKLKFGYSNIVTKNFTHFILFINFLIFLLHYKSYPKHLESNKAKPALNFINRRVEPRSPFKQKKNKIPIYHRPGFCKNKHWKNNLQAYLFSYVRKSDPPKIKGQKKEPTSRKVSSLWFNPNLQQRVYSYSILLVS